MKRLLQAIIAIIAVMSVIQSAKGAGIYPEYYFIHEGLTYYTDTRHPNFAHCYGATSSDVSSISIPATVPLDGKELPTLLAGNAFVNYTNLREVIFAPAPTTSRKPACTPTTAACSTPATSAKSPSTAPASTS